MKKVLCLVISFLLILTFASCSKGGKKLVPPDVDPNADVKEYICGTVNAVFTEGSGEDIVQVISIARNDDETTVYCTFTEESEIFLYDINTGETINATLNDMGVGDNVEADCIRDAASDRRSIVSLNIVRESFSDIPEEPPQASVQFGEAAVKALRGSYSWRVDNEDGMSQHTIADGMHPLEAREYMPCLEISADRTPGSTYIAEFVIGSNPNSITVECWPVEAFGDNIIKSEPTQIDTLEVDFADGSYGTAYFIHLKNDDYIYHIIAEWNDSRRYGGTCEYSFYTSFGEPQMGSVSAGFETDTELCGYPTAENME